MGCSAFKYSFVSGLLVRDSVNCVSTNPGQRQLTLMPSLANSRAIPLVKVMIAPLAAP